MIATITARALLPIHSVDDTNTLTPLAGAQCLLAAAGAPKSLWVAPSGGHVGALKAHPSEYQQQVNSFFDTFLHG